MLDCVSFRPNHHGFAKERSPHSHHHLRAMACQAEVLYPPEHRMLETGVYMTMLCGRVESAMYIHALEKRIEVLETDVR